MAEKSKYQFLRRVLDFYTYLGIGLLVIAIILIIIPLMPYFYYFLNAEATNDEVATLEATAAQINPAPTNAPEPPQKTLPAVDPNAPKQNWLKIPKIGVDTQIIENKNAKQALYKGVWRDPQFPKPINGKPVILAAHRYGYLEWSSEFRKKSSFRNLPQLTKGNKITIYWDQRPFEYEIYAKKTEKTVSDYSADLILYTCQYLKSDQRIFVYAKRVN